MKSGATIIMRRMMLRHIFWMQLCVAILSAQLDNLWVQKMVPGVFAQTKTGVVFGVYCTSGFCVAGVYRKDKPQLLMQVYPKVAFYTSKIGVL